MKKSVMQGGNHESCGENPHTKSPRFPYIIGRGDHFHRGCPCIPRILREWSPRLHHLVSSTSGDHVDSTSSTSNSEVHGQKGKENFHVDYVKGTIPFPIVPFV